VSEDIYVFEAIDIEPPVTEAEVEPMISAGKYQKVSQWRTDQIPKGLQQLLKTIIDLRRLGPPQTDP
jgi:hypothetical protein